MNAQDLLNHLEILGNTAEQVAESLRTDGIKGACRSRKGCPLANYLKSLGHENPSVMGNPDSAFAGLGLEPYHCTLPPACFDFLYRFDRGEFPELIA